MNQINNSFTPQKLPFRTVTVTEPIIQNEQEIRVEKFNIGKSRKSKSLGHLCKNFIKYFSKEENSIIIIDECAKMLGVERRRIYDIINILEFFGCLNRKGKNCYNWLGTKAISNSLKNFCYYSSLRAQFHPLTNDNDKIPQEKEDNIGNSFDVTGIPFLKKSFRKERSLGLICFQFISLFSISTKCILSLDSIADKLSLNEKDENTKKTKIRRLYDIANVLQSIGILKKVNVLDKKTSYEWVGDSGFEQFLTQISLKENVGQIDEITPIQTEITPSNLSKEISPFNPIENSNNEINLFQPAIIGPLKIFPINPNPISAFVMPSLRSTIIVQSSKKFYKNNELKENITVIPNDQPNIIENKKRLCPFTTDQIKTQKVKKIWKENLQLLLQAIDKNSQKE